MREIEFLPKWYSQLLKRRRLMGVEVWLFIALAGGLGLRSFLINRNILTASTALGSLRAQLTQTNSTLQQMERFELLCRQSRAKDEELPRMGIHLDSGRIVGKLHELLPSSVSLLGLGVELVETPVPTSTGLRSMFAQQSAPQFERQLRIKLQGVTPSDVDLATFLTDLNKVSFFEQISPSYVRDRRESGHILREFELSFAVRLNRVTGS